MSSDATDAGIDAAFVPRRRAGAVEVMVGDDLVVVGDLARVLNPTAALVWRCLDGSGSVAEIVDDLADVTGGERGVIERDVIALVGQLAECGLLEGVGPERVGEPGGLTVGSPFPHMRLPALGGGHVDLDDSRGRRTLLIEWSPDCGYCRKIARPLADVQDSLRSGGVALVFVADGERERNLAVFEHAGLDAPAALTGGKARPFGGRGTPAAYLIDEGGAVAAPLALGAEPVVALARMAAGIEADATTPGPGPAVRYLPASGAVCGPGVLDRTEWAGTLGYRFGDVHMGIRFNRRETAELLDQLFPGQRVEDRRVPDNYSVALFPGAGRTRNLNLLVHGAQQMVRSRSSVRILRALLTYVAADVAAPDPSLLRLECSAVVGHGRALLVPAIIVDWIKVTQPRLTRAGLQILDGPAVFVDPVRAELVVPDPAIEHDPSVLEGLDDGVNLGSERPPLGPGRVGLGAWFVATDEDHAGPLGGALAVAAVAPLVPDRARLPEVLTLLERLPALGAWFDGPDALVRRLAAFLRG